MVYELLTMIRVSVLMSFLTINICTVSGGHPQLRLVNVVMRHSDKTPVLQETFPNDPYRNFTFYPTGRGELILIGKQRVYHFGEFLRSRYDHFLGPYYTPSIVDARSSDLARTKMSLQLLLAGLFPPESVQRWSNELRWQPIPTSYQSLTTDHILLPDQTCQQWFTEYNRVLNSPEVKEQIAKLNGLMASLEALTGEKYNDTRSLANLRYTFESQEASGLKLPHWAYDFYPHGKLSDAATLNNRLRNYNDRLKRVNGGMLLSKILSDLSSYENGTLPEGRKMYLYSGRAANIHSLQFAIGVWRPHFPAFTSSVIIELWEDNKKYYVKVLYYKGIPSKLVTQKVPGCSELCPLEKFIKLRKRFTASEADLQCN